MKKEFIKVISIIEETFPKGKEELRLDYNISSKTWSVCDSNFGKVFSITTEFVLRLNELFNIEIKTIHPYFHSFVVKWVTPSELMSVLQREMAMEEPFGTPLK